MNIVTANDYNDMSKRAFDHLLAIIVSKKDPLVCTASGDSPKGLYKQLTAAVANHQLDLTNWHFVSLDEWAGMNEADEGSCRYHLDNDLYRPATIANNNLCFFDGRAADLQAECGRIETFIQTHGGIDVAIVGLGINGHVGMNEPGTDASLFAHVATIAPETQAVGQKYFTTSKNLEQGLTLGIASLLQAKHVIMLVSGEKKAAIVQRIAEGEVSDEVPTTLLRNHPSFTMFVDKDAALHLKQ